MKEREGKPSSPGKRSDGRERGGVEAPGGCGEQRGGKSSRRYLNSKVETEIREGYRKIGRQACNRSLGLTQDTRYTVDQVLDCRTCRLMVKIMKRNALSDLSGAISTGKEANVYCVSGPAIGKEKSAGEERRERTDKDDTEEEEERTIGEEGRTDRGRVNVDNDEAKKKKSNGGGGDRGSEERIETEEKKIEKGEVEEEKQEEEGGSLPWRLYAMKVYRTSILTFQDRRKYVEGDHRFERAYTKSRNPRKMVVNWVLKELRNLLRLHAAGLPCPLPIDVSSHVLLMSFAGVYTPHCMHSVSHQPRQESSDSSTYLLSSSSSHQSTRSESSSPSPSSLSSSLLASTCCSPSYKDEVAKDNVGDSNGRREEEIVDRTHGLESLSIYNKKGFFHGEKERKNTSWTSTASPRLKDLSATQLCCIWKAYAVYRAWCRLYVQAIACLRWMYQECQLVHGDFSEYNLLYYLQGLYVIDVGQAVHTAHPQALDFLKRDCRNVTSFFLNQIHHAKSQLFSFLKHHNNTPQHTTMTYTENELSSSSFSSPSSPCKCMYSRSWLESDGDGVRGVCTPPEMTLQTPTEGKVRGPREETCIKEGEEDSDGSVISTKLLNSSLTKERACFFGWREEDFERNETRRMEDDSLLFPSLITQETDKGSFHVKQMRMSSSTTSGAFKQGAETGKNALSIEREEEACDGSNEEGRREKEEEMILCLEVLSVRHLFELTVKPNLPSSIQRRLIDLREETREGPVKEKEEEEREREDKESEEEEEDKPEHGEVGIREAHQTREREEGEKMTGRSKTERLHQPHLPKDTSIPGASLPDKKKADHPYKTSPVLVIDEEKENRKHGTSMSEAVKKASLTAQLAHVHRKRDLSLLAEAIGRSLESELAWRRVGVKHRDEDLEDKTYGDDLGDNTQRREKTDKEEEDKGEAEEEEEEEEDNLDEDEVFLNSWVPSHLSQVDERRLLKKILEASSSSSLYSSSVPENKRGKKKEHDEGSLDAPRVFSREDKTMKKTVKGREKIDDDNGCALNPLQREEERESERWKDRRRNLAKEVSGDDPLDRLLDLHALLLRDDDEDEELSSSSSSSSLSSCDSAENPSEEEKEEEEEERRSTDKDEKNLHVSSEGVSSEEEEKADGEPAPMSRRDKKKKKVFNHETEMNGEDDAYVFRGKIPDGVDRKEWKKLVKEQNREKRKFKVPKHLKKNKYNVQKVGKTKPSAVSSRSPGRSRNVPTEGEKKGKEVLLFISWTSSLSFSFKMWEKKTGRNLTGNWSELAQEERERDQERLRLMSFYSFFSSSPPFSPHSRTHGGSRRERKRLNSRVRTELRKELRRLRRQARDRDERRTLIRSLTFHELLRVQTCQPMYKFIDRNHLRYVCGIISTGRESDVYCVAGRPTTTTTEVSKEVGVDAGQGGERENGDDRSKGKGEEDEGEEQTKAGGNEDDRSSRTWNLYALKVYKKTAPVLAFDEGQGARPPHGYHRDDRPHPRIRNQRKVGMNQISIEYHNLLKLREAGMPCPLPIDLSCHVLLMSFAGVYTPHCMYSIAHPKQQSSKPLPLLKASRPNNEEVPFVSYPSSPSSSSSTCCSPSRRRSSDGVYTPEHAQSPFVRRYGKSVFLLHEKNGPQKRRKPPPRWRSVAVAPRLTDLSTSSTPLCCSSQAYMLYRAWCRLYVQ
ncbi:rio1 family protein, partial [Cystoisospora suis]